MDAYLRTTPGSLVTMSKNLTSGIITTTTQTARLKTYEQGSGWPLGPSDHNTINGHGKSFRREFLPTIMIKSKSVGQNLEQTTIGQISNSTYFHSVTPDTAIKTAVQEECLNRINGKYRGALDLAVSLAEARQTGVMLKSAFKLSRYVKLLTDLKKSPSKTIADEYLQWIYGVRPLASDIYNAADTLLHKNGAPKPISLSAQVHRIERFQQVRTQNDSLGQAKFLYKVEDEYVTRYKFWITAGLTASDLTIWTSLNPLAIAYELLPFSFVADWFFNIGNYLKNYETMLLYKSLYTKGFRTDLFIRRYECNTASYIGSFPGTTGTASVYGGGKFVSQNRTPVGAWPAPRIPMLNLGLGSNQMLSLAALLRQKLN